MNGRIAVVLVVLLLLSSVLSQSSATPRKQGLVPEFKLLDKKVGTKSLAMSYPKSASSLNPGTNIPSGPRYLFDRAKVTVRGICVKSLDNSYMTFDGVNVWKYPGGLICSADRNFGLLLIGVNVATGDWIEAAGQMYTTRFGERALIVETSTVTPGYSSPNPVYIPQRFMGGGTFGANIGATGGVGLNTMGLLATTSGTVTKSTEENWPYTTVIDDGSGCETVYPGVKGVQITQDLPLSTFTLGEHITLAGVIRTSYMGGSNLYASMELVPENEHTQLPGLGMVTFNVVGGAGAAGKEVRIFDDNVNFSLTLDSVGNASVTKLVDKGQHTFSCKAYGYATEGSPIDLGETGIINFTLRESKERVIFLSEFNIIPADGETEIVVYALVCDGEGYRPAKPGKMTFALESGTIVDTQIVGPGEAVLLVRASTKYEAGRLIGRCDDSIGAYTIYYIEGISDPLVWPESPEKFAGETKSGRIEINWLCDDLDSIFGSGIPLWHHLRKYAVYIDGILYEDDMPQADKRFADAPFSFTTEIITNELANGPHEVYCIITDAVGKSTKSPILTFVSDNLVNNVKYLFSPDSDPNLGMEVDALNGRTVTVTANLKSSTSWQLIGRDIDPAQPGIWSYERVLASGTGTSVSAPWDGMLFKDGRSLRNQPDLVHLELKVESQQAKSSGVTHPNPLNSGIWMGVRTIPDREIKVLCSVGKPSTDDWHKDSYINLWPIRNYTFYQRARDAGYSAKRLGPDQSNWGRWSSIVANRQCEMVHHFGHGGNWPGEPNGPMQTGFSFSPVKRGSPRTFVTSKPSPSYPDMESLGFASGGGSLRFFFLDTCLSGAIGGSIPGAYGFPAVSDSAINDMAEALGMYYDQEWGWSEPKVYLGWVGYTYGGEDYCNFVSSVNQPYGFLQLWASTPYRIFGDVLVKRGYPYPRILTQSGAPGNWTDLLSNLRSYGSGGLGGNNAWYDLQYGVIF